MDLNRQRINTSLASFRAPTGSPHEEGARVRTEFLAEDSVLAHPYARKSAPARPANATLPRTRRADAHPG